MTAQEEHDEILSEALRKGLKLMPKHELEALIREKASENPPENDEDCWDPIEAAMRNHPGLTREKAEEMARAFGF